MKIFPASATALRKFEKLTSIKQKISSETAD